MELSHHWRARAVQNTTSTVQYTHYLSNSMVGPMTPLFTAVSFTSRDTSASLLIRLSCTGEGKRHTSTTPRAGRN